MVSYQVRAQCETHNRQYRMVSSFNRFPMNRIYKSGGNLLLTGGRIDQRTEIMTELVMSTRCQYPNLPIIILSNNSLTENILIQAAQSGNFGKLFVISEIYPNYDFFYQMSPIQITEVFTKIAENQKYRDVTNIHNYVLSFLLGLQMANGGEINLAAIRRFSQNSDKVIADYVLSKNMTEEYETINGTKDGGRSFRSLLKVLCESVKRMTSSDCETHFNLTEISNFPCTVLINSNTSDYGTLAAYFDSVLRILIGKGFPFAFFLDESALLADESFQKNLDYLKKQAQCLVGCSVENAYSVNGEDFLKNYGREIILLKGNVDPSDMQKTLTELGEYTHFEPAEYAGTPPRLMFSLVHSKNENIITYTRPKVLLEETAEFSLVIRGYNGMEIALSRRK